jgi:hypothetical protein
VLFVRHLARLLGDLGKYAWRRKAWWLIPLVLMLLAAAALVTVGQVAAPLIYTLF